jgi:hypothetical protein
MVDVGLLRAGLPNRWGRACLQEVLQVPAVARTVQMALRRDGSNHCVPEVPGPDCHAERRQLISARGTGATDVIRGELPQKWAEGAADICIMEVYVARFVQDCSGMRS